MTSITLDFLPIEAPWLSVDGDDDDAELVVADRVTKEPLDMTGWVFLSQWRRRKDSPDSEMVPLDVDTSNAAEGKVLITRSAAHKALVVAISRRGHWDIQVTMSSGRNKTLFRGPVFDDWDVSR